MTRSRRKRPWWLKLPREELLDVRICDLELSIEGTALGRRIERLHGELARRGLRFRPHVWLSTDWFTPDGVTGFAVPFYLAHPRLARLEHHFMFEVEGGLREWCMRLLRHEAGHAIDNAYRLHWRSSWRQCFGSFSEPYRQVYLPTPKSRDHVQHLDAWYSQSHPAEDWAETFAVWLAPGSRWATTYADWNALNKLEYVDQLMQAVRKETLKVRNRSRPDGYSRHKETLREFYAQRQPTSSQASLAAYDPQLRRLFPERNGRTDSAARERAASLIRRWQPRLRTWVASMTGQSRYAVDQALRAIIVRCRELDLIAGPGGRDRVAEIAVLVAVTTLGMLADRTHYSR